MRQRERVCRNVLIELKNKIKRNLNERASGYTCIVGCCLSGVGMQCLQQLQWNIPVYALAQLLRLSLLSFDVFSCVGDHFV